MNEVSVDFLAMLRSVTKDLTVVVEFYDADAIPGDQGFDPSGFDFLAGYSSVAGVTYKSRDYERKLISVSGLKRTIGKEFNSCSVSFDNQDYGLSTFHLNRGIEGLIMVVRCLSMSVSVPGGDLNDSQIFFTGRCDKPNAADKTSFPVTAKHIIGSVDIQLPRRKYTYDDDEGRPPTDPAFEGFRFLPQSGSTQFHDREPRGGLFSLFGMKRDVMRVLQYSSHSALDAEKVVPLVLGRAQLLGTHLAYIDYGNSIAMVTAFCDGGDYGISGYANFRNVSTQFTGIIITIYSPQYRYGLPGNTGTGLRAQIPLHYTGEPTATDPWPGDGFYSRTAFAGSYVNGSALNSDDPAPDLASVLFGLLVDLPNGSNEYLLVGYTDNPIYHSRFVLTSPTHMNINPGWIDDSALPPEIAHCDEFLVDQAGSDLVVLPKSERDFAGVDYKRYKSTGILSPEWFKALAGDTSVNPHELEADYQFYAVDRPPIDPDDPGGGGGGGTPDPVIPTGYRRRYTSNVALLETMPAIDFLYDVLFAGSRLFLSQAANGKLRIKVKRPADNTLLRDTAFADATSVPVYNVRPWHITQRGKLLIGAHLDTSEIRTVIAAVYDKANNEITLAASGGVSASAGTLSGADGADNTGSGVLTVTATAAEKVVTIDGYELRYTAASGDTVQTIAGMIAAQINSHPVLQKYILAVWDTGFATITVYGLLGSLQLNDVLQNSHAGPQANPPIPPTGSSASGGSLVAGAYELAYSWVDSRGGETLVTDPAPFTVTANQKISVDSIAPLPAGFVSANWYFSIGPSSPRRRLINNNDGSPFDIVAVPATTASMEPEYNSASEECIRVEMAFSDRALDASQHTRADIIRNSGKWPMGSLQSSVNQVELSYHDASQDWRTTRLTVRDDAHQKKVKKKVPMTVNGAAIDSYHQAMRVGNGVLAEVRDADFFYQWASDGESVLLEEGDVVCVTEASGGFINLPCRIEVIDLAVDKGFPKPTFTARKYASSLFDDRVTEKNIPLPSTLLGLARRNATDAITPSCGILGFKENIDLNSGPASSVVYTCPIGYRAYILGYGFEPTGFVFHGLYSLSHRTTPDSDVFTDSNWVWSGSPEFKYKAVGDDPATGLSYVMNPGDQMTLRWDSPEFGASANFYTFGFLKPYQPEDTFAIYTDEDGSAYTDETGAAYTDM